MKQSLALFAFCVLMIVTGLVSVVVTPFLISAFFASLFEGVLVLGSSTFTSPVDEFVTFVKVLFEVFPSIFLEYFTYLAIALLILLAGLVSSYHLRKRQSFLLSVGASVLSLVVSIPFILWGLQQFSSAYGI